MRSKRFAIAAMAITTAACTGEIGDGGRPVDDAPTFEEFEASTYHEDFEGGVYIVNGDTPVLDIKALEELWHELYAGDLPDGASGLVVHRNGNADARWSDTQKLALSYCISPTTFGARYEQVVEAMNLATAGWEAVANVEFTHAANEDGGCTASNDSVLFDVRGVSGQPYVARAFFPGTPRPQRNVLIDAQAFGNTGAWTLVGVLRHELGHVLGFRHEHTRPEAGTCFEDDNWRPLTPYDSESVMHYPHCNGTQTGDLAITELDAEGAAALYGAPGDEPDEPDDGTPKTGSASGSVAQGQWVHYEALAVVPGTTFTVDMTGTGDPDLYVRWGATPSLYRYDCRPYLDGADERCELTVPSDESSAFISIRGYRAGTYTIEASWTEP